MHGCTFTKYSNNSLSCARNVKLSVYILALQISNHIKGNVINYCEKVVIEEYVENMIQIQRHL